MCTTHQPHAKLPKKSIFTRQITLKPGHAKPPRWHLFSMQRETANKNPPTLHATGTRDASDPPFQLQTVLQTLPAATSIEKKKSVRFVLRCLLRRTTRSSHTGHLQADLAGSRQQPTIAKLTVHSHLKTCGSLKKVSLLTRAHYPSKSVWSLVCGFVMFATSYSSNFTPFK